MNKLKKNISIILFQQKLLKSSFIVFLPSVSINSKNNLESKFTVSKCLFSKNKILSVTDLNAIYYCYGYKQEMLKHLAFSKLKFLGVKFKNLYFSGLVYQFYSALRYFNTKTVIIQLKFVYFYFLQYIYFFLTNKFK